ncbi:MAG TPA: LppX_LprAFG lipoprotein [Streptosporangiaceae bacterium]|jgi:hypothetical protein
MTVTSRHPGTGTAARQPARRRLAGPAGLLAATAAITLIAGCGSMTGSAQGGATAKHLSPRQALSLAASTSQRINSATTTLNVQVGSNGSAGTTSGTMQMQVRPTLLVNANLKITAAGKTIPFSEILDAKTVYLKIPELSPHIGKPWVKISIADLPSGGASLSQLLQNLQNGNPLNQTQALSASKDVRATGTQVIGGVKTTRYTGTFTSAAALKSVSPQLRKVLGPQLKLLQGPVKFTVWLDDQHRTRRMIETETVAGQAITTTINITSINQPVTITPPPASQVASMPSGLLNGSA